MATTSTLTSHRRSHLHFPYFHSLKNAFTASVHKCFIRDSIYFDFWGTVSPSKDIYDFLTFLLLLWALSSDIGAGPVLMYIAVGAL